MTTALRSWIKPNQALLLNSGSLVFTYAITAGLGFFFWVLAARWFPARSVGLASAAISAMLLLGTIGMLGFGTLLIGELPRRPAQAGSLITTLLLVAGIVSGLLGILFGIVAPYLSSEFEPLAQSFQIVLLFGIGVALTAVALILDQALIGLFRGGLQLWRNALFAVSKLVLLLVTIIWLSDRHGMTIYAIWTLGIVISLVVLAAMIGLKGNHFLHLPNWKLIRRVRRPALEHYSLNIALQVPGFVLPVMVTVILSATVNASFYAAWMIAGFLFVAPYALTTVLYAIGVADPLEMAHKTRLTLKLSLLAGMFESVFLIVSATFILNLFGSSYAEQAVWSLRILALGVFPIIIRVHYVAIRRVQDQIIRAAKIIAISSLFILILAALGASTAGLTGLCLGWLLGMCLEAIILTPVVISSLELSPVSFSPR